jgi:hypothetical protein
MDNNGLLLENKRPTDWMLGSERELGGSIWKPLKEEKDGVLSWVDDEPEFENQSKAFETNACVSFSADNTFEYVGNNKMKSDSTFKKGVVEAGLVKNNKLNVSDRRTAKGSGTDPMRGNYPSAVDDYIRHNLFCPEDLYPFPDNMGRDEYYQAMPVQVRDYHKTKGLKDLFVLETKFTKSKFESKIKGWQGYHAWPDAEELMDALRYSPVWASVMIPYEFDGDMISSNKAGKAVRAGDSRAYGHRIMVRGYVKGKYWEVHDHYDNQIRKFAWDYPFGACKIMQIVKKKLAPYVVCDGSRASEGFWRSFWVEDWTPDGVYGGKGFYVAVESGDAMKVFKDYANYASFQPQETIDHFPPNKRFVFTVKQVDKF